MENDILYYSMLPVTAALGINLRTYSDTRDWLRTHDISARWNEESYERFKERSARGKLVYYVGMPGRFSAYWAHGSGSVSGPGRG